MQGMGLENLGYPTMFPLGQSYVFGQWVLHEPNIPQNPADASLPRDDYLVGFGDALTGDNVDRSHWQAADYAKAAVSIKADPDILGQIRLLYAAYINNGPLPDDAQYDSASGGGVWNASDNITKERHVYFYGGTGAWGQMSGGLILAKYLQIQGFTLNVGVPDGSKDPGMWVLPRMQGEQILCYRYNADHGGPPYDDSQWKAVFNITSWANENYQALMIAFIVILSIVITIITFGAGSAAMAALAPALLAVGITLTPTMVGAIDAMLTSFAIGAVKMALTGDSSGLMAALSQAGSIATTLSPQVVTALGNTKIGQQVTSFINNVTVQINAVTADAQAAISLGQSELSAFTNSATKLAGQFPTIDENYWNLAKTAVGGQFAPGSYFVNLARMAPDLPSLQSLEGQVPAYAAGFLQFGGTIRAAEIAQTAALEEALAAVHAGAAVSMTNVYAASLHSTMMVSSAVNPTPSVALKRAPGVGPTPSPDDIAKSNLPSKATTPLVLGALALALAKFVFKLF